jgi:spore coat protein U-like protein
MAEHESFSPCPKQGETKMKKFLSVLSLVTLSLIIAGAGTASAAEETESLEITATVVAYCNVTTSPVDFGNVDGQVETTTTGSISVDCTFDQTYHVALDAGTHFSTNRRILSGGYATPYYLTKPSGGVAWGDSDYDNTFAAGASLLGTGIGSAQTLTVNGRLPVFTGIPSGTVLTDTITVTVTY